MSRRGVIDEYRDPNTTWTLLNSFPLEQAAWAKSILRKAGRLDSESISAAADESAGIGSHEKMSSMRP